MQEVSLIAAYLAGVVALFAPCCATFMLPAYVGSVLKQKTKVLAVTLVFGLGVAVVMLPAVVGVGLVARMLFRYHSLVYYSGGIMMIAFGLLSLAGIKLHPPDRIKQWVTRQKGEMASVFALGVFSGIASACCAPVLAGVLALSWITPSFWGGVGVGSAYVLGMLTPLVLSGWITASQKVFNKDVFNRKIGPFALTNLIAAAIFIGMGVWIVYLTFNGQLSMENSETYARGIENTAKIIDDFLRRR